MGGRVEIGFKLKNTYFDAMINYQLSQKLKLIGNFYYVNNYCNNYNVEFVLTKLGNSTFTGYMTKGHQYFLLKLRSCCINTQQSVQGLCFCVVEWKKR